MKIKEMPEPKQTPWAVKEGDEWNLSMLKLYDWMVNEVRKVDPASADILEEFHLMRKVDITRLTTLEQTVDSKLKLMEDLSKEVIIRRGKDVSGPSR